MRFEDSLATRKEGVLIDTPHHRKDFEKGGLTRKYHVRKITYKYIRNERKPGELLEIDVKYVPGKIANKRYFQFTHH